MPTVSEILRAIRAAKWTDLDTWRGRLVVWTAAAMAGLLVVLFAWLSEYAIRLFFRVQNLYWWSPLILTPAAGVAIVWLTRRFFPGAGGSGIPQTIAAIHQPDGSPVLPHLVSLRVAVAKVLLGAGGLAAGFSAGREGPSVQIGASVMHAFQRFLPNGFAVDPRHLILAGGAAGISAAFNTPLAGIIFAIEELGRRFEQKTNGVIIAAIVLSGLVSISLQGNYTYFGNLAVGVIDRSIVIPVIVCGLICGLAGGIFSRTLIDATKTSNSWTCGKRLAHPLRWAAFCGFMVALLGLVSNGAVHGSGYVFTREMLIGGFDDTWIYAPAKYLATIFTYLSGIPGGIFAPSLSIGAGIGNDLLPLFSDHLAPTAIYALCMVGFLAAATQAPITSFIIVMEMIDGHEMVISLMAVSLIASLVSRIFSPPLYATLASTYLGAASVQPGPR